MNKPELIIKMQEKLNTVIPNINFSKKDSEIILDAIGDVIVDTLKRGDDVKLPNIGTFNVVDKAARTAHNPKTGEPVSVPAKKAPHFSASKTFKNAII